MLKVGNRVTVVSTVTGGIYFGHVTQLAASSTGDWFQVRDRADRDRTFGRILGEENIDWARGWSTPAALALRARVALERSR